MVRPLHEDPVFRAGLVLTGLAVLQLALAWVVDPRWGAGLGATMAAELVAGREAAIPLAMAQGVPSWWIVAASIVQNLGLAAVVVPAAMVAVEGSEQGSGRVARFLRRMHAAADRNRHRASSAWGIFAFMLVPFLANGPIIAGLVGRLVGIGPRRLAVAVAAAVVVTATAWTYLYATLDPFLAGVDPLLASIPSVLALLATLAAVVRLSWPRRSEKAP